MNPEVYDQFSRVEQNHWWFAGRRVGARELLRKWLKPSAQRALDLGSGTGGNFLLLKEFCARVDGIDASSLALKLAQESFPEGHWNSGNLNDVNTWPQGLFDLVTCFNVLYHSWVDDPVQVIAGASQRLNPGGVLLVTEPAFTSLFREHDRQVMGKRRFRVSELAAAAQEAGLEVKVASYFNTFSFFPAWVLARLPQSRVSQAKQENLGVGEVAPPPAWMNFVLRWAIHLEWKAMSYGWRWPVGVTAVVLATQPEAKNIKGAV